MAAGVPSQTGDITGMGGTQPPLPTTQFGNPATFTAAANTQGSDYDKIMAGYTNLAQSYSTSPSAFTPAVAAQMQAPTPTSASFVAAPQNVNFNSAAASNPINAAQIASSTPANFNQIASSTPTNFNSSSFNPATAQLSKYQQSADVTGSLSDLSNLATTGGYSEADKQDIRARDTSPIRSIYANAQQNAERSKALGGGYSPNFNAVQASMARDQANQVGNVTTAANAGIAQNVASNKLSAAPAYASASATANAAQTAADQHNTDIINQINQFNATGQAQNSQFNSQGQAQNNQFNTSAQNAINAANSQGQLNANQFNTSSQNAINAANASAQNQTNQFNTNAQNQNNQFNTTGQFNASAQNATNKINTDIANMNSQNSTNQFNSGAMSAAKAFNAGASNDTNKFNATGKFNADTANKQGIFGALGGMASLYGTTPALTNTFGNQVVQAAGIGQGQQNIDNGRVGNILRAAG